MAASMSGLRLQRRVLTPGAPPAYLLVVPAVVGVAMLLPPAYLVVRALSADAGELAGLLARPRTLELLGNTVALAAAVLGTTTAVALPLAWLTVRTAMPLRRTVTVMAVLPLAVPGYVAAFALLSVGGDTGLLASVGLPVARPSGLVGATLALSIYSFPYMFLNIRASLLGMDPAVEESARSLGYGPARVFVSVILPMLVPGIAAGALITVLYTIGDFGAVALMRYEVFSYVIYTQYVGAFDRTYASALALVLLLLAAGPVLLEATFLSSRRFLHADQVTVRLPRRVALGWWHLAVWPFLLVVAAGSVGLPLISPAFEMLRHPPWGQLQGVLGAFANSARAAAPAAVVATAVAVPIAYVRVRYPTRAGLVAERVSYIGFAVPPLALALSLVFFSLRVIPPLYQRLPLLIGAFVLNFLALAVGPIRSTFMKLPRRIEEAARTLGYGPVAAFFAAVLPAAREGLRASALLVLVMAMKELPMTTLLAPTGFTTLSTAVFARTSEALYAEAAPYAAAIVLFSCLFVGLILRYESEVTP